MVNILKFSLPGKRATWSDGNEDAGIELPDDAGELRDACSQVAGTCTGSGAAIPLSLLTA